MVISIFSLEIRFTSIEACLATISLYNLSLFKILVSVADSLEKLTRDFLWSREGSLGLEEKGMQVEERRLGLGNPLECLLDPSGSVEFPCKLPLA